MKTTPEILTLPETRLQQAPSYFHAMAKPTGAIYNLDCRYCLFLSNEVLYPGNRFCMTDDVMEAAGVNTVVELAQRNPVNLYAKTNEVNTENDLMHKMPNVVQVDDRVSQAKSLSWIFTS